MDAQLKYIPPELLSIERQHVDAQQLQASLAAYEQTQRLPLIIASRYGQFKRYKVRAQREAALAAQHLKLDAVWVLVVPAGPLPFDLGGEGLEDTPAPATADAPEASAQSKTKRKAGPQATAKPGPRDKLEEAIVYERAIKRGLSQQAVAKEFGVSRSYVNNALQLTKLRKEAREAFLSGALTASQARILSYEKDDRRQRDLLAWVKAHQPSARALERAIYHKMDIQTEKVQLSYLAGRLSELWGCPVSLKMGERGLSVQANPHKDQLALVISDVSALDMISDLSWQEKGQAAQLALTFLVTDNAAFSAWIEKLRLSDVDDLGLSVEPVISAIDGHAP